MVACAALAFWAAVPQFQAKRCLDGTLHGGTQDASRGITERGCEIVTDSGATVVKAITGPPFEVGVAAVVGFIASGFVLTVVTIRSRRRPEGDAAPLNRVLIGCLIAYLSAGALFAAATMPQQLWTCPDPDAPHGHITFGNPPDPPRDDCEPTVTVGERVSHFLFAVPAWLPVLTAKGLSNVAQP